MNKKAFWYPTVLALITAIISGVSNFINKIGVTVVFDPVVYTTIKNSLVAIFLIGIILVLKKWKEKKDEKITEKMAGDIIMIITDCNIVDYIAVPPRSIRRINSPLVHKSFFHLAILDIDTAWIVAFCSRVIPGWAFS